MSDTGPEQKVESLVISIATSMWSAFQKTVLIPASLDEGETTEDFEEANSKFTPQTLANLSSSLLLSLVCYTEFDQKPNFYKQMLSLFQNAQGNFKHLDFYLYLEVSSLANLEASFKLDFTALYNRLCDGVQEKLGMLLLYMLLHKNSGFRNFVLSRINLENLVLPIVRVLNDGVLNLQANTSSHQTYLALIVLLILSEDDFFFERPIHEISLGGLIILVFVRAIHTNTDRYLHTNSLAALANMASYFKNLSPLVCQKLIGLLETMTRRHGKLFQKMRLLAENEQKTEDTQENDNSELDKEFIRNELNENISALEEGIRNVLEIINACLCKHLRSNPDLIYSILYKRELFELFNNHPMFNDLVWNIYMVINHFTSKVEFLTTSANVNSSMNANNNASLAPTISNPPSVSTVLDAIRKAAIEWPTDRLKKCPELKFKYIEDENTVDFFVPYVWKLIWQSSGIYFAPPNSIKLFNLGTCNPASHLTTNDSIDEIEPMESK